MSSSGVVEDAVENDAHAAAMARIHQLSHGGVAAEHRVHLHEIAGMVTVVGGAEEDGRHVDAVDAEGLDVVEVGGDAAEGPALEGADRGGSTPVVQEGADGVARGVRGESVGENLVHHRVFPPVRGAGGVVGGGGDDHAVVE